ncbi:MAG: hypothetical protein IJV62_01480 [Eggerthellaceae bacterium]|nr:hypothetical protein [Eggerthellaceae bacterium]
MARTKTYSRTNASSPTSRAVRSSQSQAKKTYVSTLRHGVAGTSALAPQTLPHTAIRVRPGGARDGRVSIPAHVQHAFVIALVGVFFVALISFVRIALITQTVQMSIEANTLDQQIEALHSQSAALEVQHSRLANTSVVREQALAMGMTSPESITYVDLSEDVVVTDAAGDLSLVGSMQAFEAIS